MAKNYYVILGVDPDASQEQIKSAYRQKVKEFHPDYYGDDSGPFLAVQEAYTVLSDLERRRAYDDELAGGSRHRNVSIGRAAEWLRSKRAPVEPLIPTAPLTDLEEDFFGRSFETYEFWFEQIFDRFWSRFDMPVRSRRRRVENIDLEIALTREQARRGGQVRVRLPVPVRCPTCGGRGGVGFFECRSCFGQGLVTEEYPLLIDFPAGLPSGHRVKISLARFGLVNTYLTIYFSVE